MCTESCITKPGFLDFHTNMSRNIIKCHPCTLSPPIKLNLCVDMKVIDQVPNKFNFDNISLRSSFEGEK